MPKCKGGIIFPACNCSRNNVESTVNGRKKGEHVCKESLGIPTVQVGSSKKNHRNICLVVFPLSVSFPLWDPLCILPIASSFPYPSPGNLAIYLSFPFWDPCFSLSARVIYRCLLLTQCYCSFLEVELAPISSCRKEVSHCFFANTGRLQEFCQHG